jgi:hypothetical protein
LFLRTNAKFLKPITNVQWNPLNGITVNGYING